MFSSRLFRWVFVLTFVAAYRVAPAHADVVSAAWVLADLFSGTLGLALVTATGCWVAYNYLMGAHHAHETAGKWALGAFLFFSLTTVIGYFRG